MSLSGLGIIGGLIKQGIGFFTTRESDKRKARKEAMKEIVQIMRDNKKERSVVGWAGLIILLVAIIWDISATGGDNFDILLTIFGAWGSV